MIMINNKLYGVHDYYIWVNYGVQLIIMSSIIIIIMIHITITNYNALWFHDFVFSTEEPVLKLQVTTHKLWNDVKNYNDLAHFETACGTSGPGGSRGRISCRYSSKGQEDCCGLEGTQFWDVLMVRARQWTLPHLILVLRFWSWIPSSSGCNLTTLVIGIWSGILHY